MNYKVQRRLTQGTVFGSLWSRGKRAMLNGLFYILLWSMAWPWSSVEILRKMAQNIKSAPLRFDLLIHCFLLCQGKPEMIEFLWFSRYKSGSKVYPIFQPYSSGRVPDCNLWSHCTLGSIQVRQTLAACFILLSFDNRSLMCLTMKTKMATRIIDGRCQSCAKFHMNITKSFNAIL